MYQLNFNVPIKFTKANDPGIVIKIEFDLFEIRDTTAVLFKSMQFERIEAFMILNNHDLFKLIEEACLSHAQEEFLKQIGL